MHPEIRKFPSEEFYSNKLCDAQRITLEVEKFNSGTLEEGKKPRVVSNLVKVGSQSHLNPVMFFNLTTHEETHGKSFRNQMECHFVMSFLTYLAPLLKDYSIGIITPYKSQVELIKNEIHNRKHSKVTSSSTTNSTSSTSSNSNMIDENTVNNWKDLIIEVNTVDGFQGKEKDFIILSTVRTRSLGFLTDLRRLNVAITRAKKCLILVGNERLLREDKIWKDMFDDLHKRDCVHQISRNNFRDYVHFSKLNTTFFGESIVNEVNAPSPESNVNQNKIKIKIDTTSGIVGGIGGVEGGNIDNNNLKKSILTTRTGTETQNQSEKLPPSQPNNNNNNKILSNKKNINKKIIDNDNNDDDEEEEGEIKESKTPSSQHNPINQNRNNQSNVLRSNLQKRDRSMNVGNEMRNRNVANSSLNYQTNKRSRFS